MDNEGFQFLFNSRIPKRIMVSVKHIISSSIWVTPNSIKKLIYEMKVVLVFIRLYFDNIYSGCTKHLSYA